MRKILILLFWFWGTAVMTGCTLNDNLEKWVEAENSAARQKYEPLYGKNRYAEVLEPYDFVLAAAGMVQPFSPQKLRLLGGPDQDGKRGILENYDLAEMKYVGYMAEKTGNKGLIDVNNQVFIITIGAPIGKNYGKVKAISPRSVLIEEHAEDGEGSWLTTRTELELTKNK